MTVHKHEWAVSRRLDRIDVSLRIEADDTVQMIISGRSELRREALWTAQVAFTGDEGPRVVMDELYAVVHDVLVARPASKPAYDEARAYKGQVTLELPLGN